VSNLLFPALPGQVFITSRMPKWNTGALVAPSGMSGRVALQKNPLYEWTLTWDLLRDNKAVTLSELALLVGFFNAVRGQWDTWLFSDPSFNTVTNEPFGAGDGSTKSFPLIATYRPNTSTAGIAELIQNLNGAPTIKDNGSTVSGGLYTIGPTGIITFTTAPTAGHALTWTGSFYYRCVFSSDDAEFSEFMSGLWEQTALKFESIYLATQ